MSDKTPVTVYLDPGEHEAIQAVADEYALAKSRVVSDIIGKQIGDDGDLSDAVEDAIPEPTRQLAARRREDERMRDRQELRERKASWGDRIKGHFRERIEGDQAYRPDDMDELAEGYVEDAQIWMDDDDRVDEARDQVETWLSYYRAGYWAREHADAVETEVNSDDVSGWFGVGEDVHRLREHVDEVEEHIRRVADGPSGWDSDAVVESVATRWSVSEGAVRLLIELMIDDDPGETSVQEAIALGGDRVGSATSAAGRLTADGGDSRSVDPDELPDDAVLRDRDADARSRAESGATVEDDVAELDGGEP